MSGNITTRPGDLGVPFRLPLLMLGFLSLATGVGSGLLRMGWAAPFSPELVLLQEPVHRAVVPLRVRRVPLVRGIDAPAAGGTARPAAKSTA